MACIRKRYGKWIVDFYMGNQRRKVSFETKAEAENFKRELFLRPIDQTLGFQQIKMVSIPVAVKEYLETVTPKKSEKTWRVDQHALRAFSETYKVRQACEVSQRDLEVYQLELVRKYNPATVNRKFTVIKHFFKKCREWNYLREVPTLYLKKLAETPKQKIPLLPGQVSQLISSLPDWAANVTYFIARTGVRRGEAVNLIWKNVDLLRRTVTIQSKKGGHIRVREIPLVGDLLRLLVFLNDVKARAKDGLRPVFVGPWGNKLQEANLSLEITRAGRRLGIPNAGLHILRHTILTTLAENNQSGSTIQKLAGHSNLATTQMYLHHSTEHLRKTLEEHETNVILIRPKLISEAN